MSRTCTCRRIPAAVGDGARSASEAREILLVEDDEVVGTLLVELLGALGRRALGDHRRGGLRGRRTGRDWDLVVSDVDLPGHGRARVRPRIKRTAALATLILSGHSSLRPRGRGDARRRRRLPDQADRRRPRCSRRRSALVAVTRERRAAGREVVLAVGAHPDDVEIGVGGILLRHAAAGPRRHRAHADRRRGGRRRGRARRGVAARGRAAGRAARSTPRWRTRASARAARRSARSVDVIEEIRPTTVYTHTIRDVHQDHRNAHNATLVAARGDLARLLLPGAVDHGRVPADPVRRRSTSTSTPSSRSSRPTPRRSRSAATSTRSCCARPPATGRASPRRATSSRSRSSATATRPAAAATRRAVERRSGAALDAADAPRVLVTGAGGPSGDLDPAGDRGRARSTCSRATSTRSPPGLYLVDARAPRSLLPRGDDPRFADELLALCEREAIDVSSRPSTASCSRWRARAGAFAAAGVTLVLASEETLADLPGQVGAGRALPRRRARAGRRSSPTTRSTPRRRAAGDRQAALGQRLARDPARRAPRGARGASSATARCSCRSTCPAPSTRSTCSPAPTATSPRVVPRARLKVDSGIAVTGRTLHDAGARARSRARSPTLIGLTTVANVQVKERRVRRARAARGQRPLPGHDAADRSPPASTCRGSRSARRSASRSRTGRCRSRTSRWCATSRSASSPSTTSPTCSATRREIAA